MKILLKAFIILMIFFCFFSNAYCGFKNENNYLGKKNVKNSEVAIIFNNLMRAIGGERILPELFSIKMGDYSR